MKGLIYTSDSASTMYDVVKYRNKIGKDLMLEVIRAYVQKKDKNINLLLDYARKLRVEKIIRPYLEIIFWKMKSNLTLWLF